jgi:hypothetical protein
MVMSAALAFGPALTGCGDECDKRCDDFVKCMRNLRGGTLKKGTSLTKKACIRECKKDRKRCQRYKQRCEKEGTFFKQLDKVCR